MRAEIESIEGRLRYLSNQVTFSTLTITFYKVSAPFGFGYKFGKSLRNGWDNLLWVFIALANLWAIILFGIAVWITIVYVIRKRKKRKNAVPPRL